MEFYDDIVKYCNEITQYDYNAYDKFKQFSIIEKDNTDSETDKSEKAAVRSTDEPSAGRITSMNV